MFSLLIFYSLIHLSYGINNNNNNNEWVRVTKNSLVEIRVTDHQFNVKNDSTFDDINNNNNNYIEIGCQDPSTNDSKDVFFVELEYEQMKKNETSSITTVRSTLEKEVKFDSCRQLQKKDNSFYYEKNANIAFFLPLVNDNSEYRTTSGKREIDNEDELEKKKQILKTSIKASLVQREYDERNTKLHEKSSRATITPPSRIISTVIRDSDGTTIQVDPLHLNMEWETRKGKESNHKNTSRRRSYLHNDMLRFYIELIVLFIAIGFQRNSSDQSLGLKNVHWKKYWKDTCYYTKRMSCRFSRYLRPHATPIYYYYFYHPLSKVYHYFKEFHLRNNINMTMISCPPEIIRLSHPKLFLDNTRGNLDCNSEEENCEVLTEKSHNDQHVQRNQLKENNEYRDLGLISTTVSKSEMEVTKDMEIITTYDEEKSQRGDPQDRLFPPTNNEETSVQGQNEQSHHIFNSRNDVEETHSKTNKGPDTYVTEDTKGKKECDFNFESITESSHSSIFVKVNSRKNQRLIVSSQGNGEEEEDTAEIEPQLRTDPSCSQAETIPRPLDPEVSKTENDPNHNNEGSPFIELKPSDALLSISYDLMKPVWEFGQTPLERKDARKREKHQDDYVRKQARCSTIPTSIVIPSTRSLLSFCSSRKRKSLKQDHTVVKLRRSKRKRGASYKE